MSGVVEALSSEMAAALVAALGELDELARDKEAKVKTKDGGSYSYSYTDLGSVLGYVRPILKEHGLALMTPLSCDGQNVTVTPRLVHTSGAVVVFDSFSLPAGRTPQETGSAATYARRYSVLAVLNLATEDDDGATATEGARRREAAPRPPSKPAGAEQFTQPEVGSIMQRIQALPGPMMARARRALPAGIPWPVPDDLSPDLASEAEAWVSQFEQAVTG